MPGAVKDEVTAVLPTETVTPPTHLNEPSVPRSGTTGTTVGSPLEALERDEILRTRKFCGIAFGIALLGACAVPLLPGDPTVTVILVSAVSISMMAILFLLHRTSDPVQFRRPSTLLGWFIPAVCVTSTIPFFGAFSPACVILVLGIYFTGLGRSTPLAYAVYGVCAGAQALVAGLVIAGVIHDTGIVKIAALTRFNQIVIQLLVQAVLFATLLTARVSRRTALLAVGELERAVRFAAHREALLLEAREELERALLSGRGRFTDQTLGTYKLGAVLGRGAMGEVYEAVDAHGSTVAIKLLSQASLGNVNHVMRFLRELRTTVGLESPNIVKVLDVGEQPVPHLVMEKLEGKTLSEILKSKQGLPLAEVADMVRQVGAGITAAARSGIIHRDLKPQNVFLHGRTWKILDFGVARAVDAGDTLTAGHVVGTPSYMAPEQANGSAVDHASDLYALAAIAYRALTNSPPFAAGEIAETLYRVVHTAPPRPTWLADHLPLDVDLVLAIGLAKRPRDRFASAGELSDALAQALASRLPDAIRERGVALVAAGAWAVPKRSSTTRMRGPGL